MNYFLALDIGTRRTQRVVGDQEGNVLVNQKIVHRPEALRNALRPYAHQKIQCAFEACGQERWILDLLKDLGIEGVLVHPYRVKLIAESRIKTDKIDGEILYQLLRAKFLPTVYQVPNEKRDLRERLRYRLRLVHTRTSLKNRIHGILFGFGKRSPVSDLFGVKGRKWLEDLLPSFPPIYQKEIRTYLELIDRLTQEVDQLTQELDQELKSTQVMTLLDTHPGLGRVLAATLYYEIVDIERFVCPKKLVSYAGMAPRTFQSGLKRYGGAITHQGNCYLRWASIEAAQRISRSDPLGQFLTRLERTKGHQSATVAVGRKILCNVYWMWKKKMTYSQLFRRSAFLAAQKQKRNLQGMPVVNMGK